MASLFAVGGARIDRPIEYDPGGGTGRGNPQASGITAVGGPGEIYARTRQNLDPPTRGNEFQRAPIRIGDFATTEPFRGGARSAVRDVLRPSS